MTRDECVKLIATTQLGERTESVVRATANAARSESMPAIWTETPETRREYYVGVNVRQDSNALEYRAKVTRSQRVFERFLDSHQPEE